MRRAKKIAIVHYRVGRTDGVSLEIDKRKAILEGLGHEVKLISGPVQNGSDYVIEELEFDLPEIKEIKENSFKYFNTRTLQPGELMDRIYSVASRIEDSFLSYYSNVQFDALLLHNIFSLAIHLPATFAFANIVGKLHIPVIATHHDYYWEKPEYADPTDDSIRCYLEKYVPPDHKNITHISINSLAAKELQKKREIESFVFPDIFDFKQNPWQKDEYNADFLDIIGVKDSDLIILQATRIVERKGIEIAIDFVKQLIQYKHKLIGKKLYNGKVLTEDSEIVFLLAGYAESFAQSYLEKLKREIMENGIHAKFIHSIIDADRRKGKTKIYSLWDAYVYADLVTYPSWSEGWGNQFIEAVFARKPVVVFEYPVFKADIKNEGYAYISLGDVINKCESSGLVTIPNYNIERAVDETMEWLTLRDIGKTLDKNFEIGTEYHDYDVIKEFLNEQFSK